MCGIAGYFCWIDEPDADFARWVSHACDQLTHRGPDAGGLYTSRDGRCVLGSRRLAIRDLSEAGHQPMANENETVWVVFNGEIYNADRVRKHLVSSGHQFRSKSDTEVLVHLYEERRTSLVDDLDGMFSFVLYDTVAKVLFGARDRLGVKPLYYALSARRFAFASEPKGLLALPDVSRAPHLEELPSYLAFSCVPGPPTLHRDINKLEPGTRFTVDRYGHLRSDRYWSFPPSVDDGADDVTLHAALDTALGSAVAKRNVAEVPIGATLSGGIDSGLVVAHMTASLGGPVNTFTVGYPGDAKGSDLFHARLLAQVQGTRHHEVLLDDTGFEHLLDELPELADDPNGSASLIGYLHIARHAQRCGVKVLQIGEGADEAFAGYGLPCLLARARAKLATFGRLLPHGLAPALARWFENPIERLLSTLAGHHRFDTGLVDAFRRYARQQWPYWGFGTVFASRQGPLFGPDRNKAVTAHERLVQRLAMEDGLQGRPYVDQLALIDMLLQLPERLLMRADRATMRYGVEARVPFLDPEVLTVAFRIPPRLRAATPKAFLREHARRRLPPVIAERPKLGFPCAAKVFLAPGVRARIRERVLARSFLELTGLAAEPVAALVAAAEYKQAQVLAPLWTLYVLSLWAHHWL